MAFENADFKNGGYVAAVAALHEGANFSLTLPNLEDWLICSFYVLIVIWIKSKRKNKSLKV